MNWCTLAQTAAEDEVGLKPHSMSIPVFVFQPSIAEITLLLLLAKFSLYNGIMFRIKSEVVLD